MLVLSCSLNKSSPGLGSYQTPHGYAVQCDPPRRVVAGSEAVRDGLKRALSKEGGALVSAINNRVAELWDGMPRGHGVSLPLFSAPLFCPSSLPLFSSVTPSPARLVWI